MTGVQTCALPIYVCAVAVVAGVEVCEVEVPTPGTFPPAMLPRVRLPARAIGPAINNDRAVATPR